MIGIRRRSEIALDLGEDGVAVHLGQVEVEQDEVGPRRFEVAVTLVEEVQRLFAVVDDVQGAVDAASG